MHEGHSGTHLEAPQQQEDIQLQRVLQPPNECRPAAAAVATTAAAADDDAAAVPRSSAVVAARP